MGLLSIRRKLISLLEKEIDKYIPNFEPNSSDYEMITYAFRDLEEYLMYIWSIDDKQEISLKIQEILKHESSDFKILINIWTSLWVNKWRERVKILLSKPKIPHHIVKKYESAKNIYRGIENRNELKKMVTRRLLSKNEICMVGTIADNLIIEEIVRRNPIINKNSKIFTLDLYNSTSLRISKLSKEKGPLIYLSIKSYTL
jgi:hypothetical protein